MASTLENKLGKVVCVYGMQRKQKKVSVDGEQIGRQMPRDKTWRSQRGYLMKKPVCRINECAFHPANKNGEPWTEFSQRHSTLKLSYASAIQCLLCGGRAGGSQRWKLGQQL